jgi:flavin reductase (DIM6/NTAB) family NADH-FMN oxidoreductase RutF
VTAVASPAELRAVFAAFPTGVAAVAAMSGSAPIGLAASSFVPVSLDPPLVSVCIARTSTTWPALRTAARLGISVLGHHQEWVSRQLSATGADRFTGLSWRATADGAVLLAESSAWFDCGVEREIPAGDHEIVLLGVHDLGASGIMPLVFHGSTYRSLQARAMTCGHDGKPDVAA